MGRKFTLVLNGLRRGSCFPLTSLVLKRNVLLTVILLLCVLRTVLLSPVLTIFDVFFRSFTVIFFSLSPVTPPLSLNSFLMMLLLFPILTISVVKASSPQGNVRPP